MPPCLHTCHQSSVITTLSGRHSDIRASIYWILNWGNDSQPRSFKINKNTPQTLAAAAKEILSAPPPPQPPPRRASGLGPTFVFYYIFNTQAGARQPGAREGGSARTGARMHRPVRRVGQHAAMLAGPSSPAPAHRKFDAGRRKALNCWLTRLLC